LADGGHYSRFNGTVSFAAPEIALGTGRYNGLKAESWTLGILLYTMAFKRAPFLNSHAARIETLIIPSNTPNSRELVMIDLIRKLLEKDPSKRISINSIPLHPWIK
jgi:serine/threonine protein kinase